MGMLLHPFLSMDSVRRAWEGEEQMDNNTNCKNTSILLASRSKTILSTFFCLDLSYFLEVPLTHIQHRWQLIY